MKTVTFTVEVQTTIGEDQITTDELARFMAIALDGTFGMDRFTILHNGRRLIFDSSDAAFGWSRSIPAEWTADGR